MIKENYCIRYWCLLDTIQNERKLTGDAMQSFVDCLLAGNKIIQANCGAKIREESIDTIKLLKKLAHDPKAVENNTLYFTKEDYNKFRKTFTLIKKALPLHPGEIKC